MSPKWTSCQKTESEKNDITFHKNKIPKKECCICNIKQTEYKEWVKVKHNYIIIIIIIICSYVVEGSEQLHVSAIAAIIRLYIAWERSWVQYATTVKIKITKITKSQKTKLKQNKTKPENQNQNPKANPPKKLKNLKTQKPPTKNQNQEHKNQKTKKKHQKPKNKTKTKMSRSRASLQFYTFTHSLYSVLTHNGDATP